MFFKLGIPIFLIFYLPILGVVSGFIFYKLWLTTSNLKIRSLQFSLAVAILRSVVVALIYLISKIGFSWNSAFSELLNSMMMFITIGVSITITNMIYRYNGAFLEEELEDGNFEEELEDDNFEEELNSGD